MSESLIITIITVIVGPVVVLYIANIVKNMKPKPDRLDMALDIYEKTIKRQDDEITRLNIIIDRYKAKYEGEG